MLETLRYLLLQVRNPEDPMAGHEVRCFARALHCGPDQLEVCDLLAAAPTARHLAAVDAVLLGGSGDYSVAEGGPWLAAALDAMRDLAARCKPTFASCWGFQAMAAALGGDVVTDLSRAEVGTCDLALTEAGRADPVFGILPAAFPAQLGHQDIVDRLPAGAVRLAASGLVENEAFRLEGKPIYCTQFHPELTKALLLDRLRTYPKYLERIAGMPYERFVLERCRETPETEALLPRFRDVVFGQKGAPGP